MSTRAQIRFATREEGVSFSEHPDKIHAQFYVHHDGYPEGLGLDIAKSIHCGGFKLDGVEIEHVQDYHGDLEYIYYVWSDYDKTTWMSVFSGGGVCGTCGKDYDGSREEIKNLGILQNSTCIFVGTPKQFIEKYDG
jgi:hypothetical protein